MTSVPLEISVVSADVFKKPKFFSRPCAYVVVTLAGDSVSRQRTPADEHNGGKPFWNFTMRFEVERSKLQRNSAVLVFQLRRRRTIGDKDIGSVYVPVKELFDGAAGTNRSRPVAFPVSSRSGKPKGVVYLSYAFGDSRAGTILSRESRIPRFPRSSDTMSALGQRDRGISGQQIPRPVRETTVVGGGERVLVPSAPPCPVQHSSETTSALGQRDRGISGQKIPMPVLETTAVGCGERVLVPSAPPCPVPSAPYLPIGGYFPANTSPWTPYIRQDFGSLI